jgi:peptidoglycan/xylan/chitin deacetylase (PgdA/CDA1 family)
MIGARRLVEASLVACGVDRWALGRRRGRVVVLAYHNIIPDDAAATGDRSLHLRRKGFAEQLDVLVELCDIVPLTAVLLERPHDARPAVAITFDDAYHGALTLGAEELLARQLPATMFAAPGLLGGSSFWWDAIAGSRELPDAVRDYALLELRGDGESVRAWAATTGQPVREMPDWGRPGTESDLRAWTAVKSFTVGAHTWRHVNLARLAGAELEAELANPLVWLRDRCGASLLPWLTYPYGLTTRAAAAAAKALGYDAALAVTGGWLGWPITDPYVLPRLNVPAGLTAGGFRLRVAGITGRPVASTQQSRATARTAQS